MTTQQEDHEVRTEKPVVALTMGDVAGVGPEVVAAAVSSSQIHQICAPIVIGDPVILERFLSRIPSAPEICVIRNLTDVTESASTKSVWCWNPTKAETASVSIGHLSADAGQAAYDWLIAATQAALEKQIDAIVTAPLNKEALHLAGHHYPGHTEILAEKCGVNDFAMMLYLPAGEVVKGPFGLGVAHVTLHTSIASVPELLSTAAIQEKISLTETFLQGVGCESPRIGVCALNPHGGENGLFGNEEAAIISPAIKQSQNAQLNAKGPFPADTLLQQAVAGRYDGVVAMYHDQGHIALKLIAFQRAVNVTLGLPIVRTSPSHGTAFDIAGKNLVETAGMVSAIRTAVQLVDSRA